MQKLIPQEVNPQNIAYHPMEFVELIIWFRNIHTLVAHDNLQRMVSYFFSRDVRNALTGDAVAISQFSSIPEVFKSWVGKDLRVPVQT